MSSSEVLRVFRNFTTATALLFVAMNAHAEDLRWLAGPWQIEYNDKTLGNIVGVADIKVGGTSVSQPLTTGTVVVFGPDLERYELHVDYTRVEDGNVQVHLKGDSPPSGMEGVAELIQGDAQIIPGQEKDVVRAAWGNARHNASVVAGRQQDLYIVFPIPADGEAETINGTWKYQPGMISQIPANRGGDVEDDGTHITVSGKETWVRPNPHLNSIITEGDATVQTLASPTSPLTTPFWISAAGYGLPVQPKRDAVVRALSGNVNATGAWRVHPDNPESIQLLASVNTNMPPDPVPVTVNDAEGYWLPVMPGDEPLSIRVVRQYSDDEFFAIDRAFAGDLVIIEAEYEKAPFTNRLRFGLLTDDLYPIVGQAGADEASEGVLEPHFDTIKATFDQEVPARTEVWLRRTAKPNVFRSEPLLIQPADTGDLPRYVDLSGRAEQSLTARSDIDELLIWEVDPVAHTNPKKVVSIPVLKRPDTTLWPDALNTAQRCRDSGKSKTFTWNIDYFNAVAVATAPAGTALSEVVTRKRSDVVVTEEITLEDHAGALLLRRELVNRIEDSRAHYRSGDGISSAEIDEMIYLGFRRDFHPLFPLEIDVPTNNKYAERFRDMTLPLGMLFKRDVFELYFEGDEKAYREFLQLAVANAAGQALDASDRAFQHASKPDDCDVLNLLMISGRQMAALVDIVRPELIKENPDPQGVPRFIQDRTAVRAVTGVATKQASIEANDALSTAQLDIVLTVGTLGVTAVETVAAKVGLQALTALRAARLAGMTIDLIDDYRLYGASQQLRSANEEVELARGILGVVGDARYVQAVERHKDVYWSVATGFSLRFMSVVLSGRGNLVDNWKYKYKGFSLLVRPETTDMIVHKAALFGMESLNRFDRAFLEVLYRKLPSNPARFSDLDRAIAALFGRGSQTGRRAAVQLVAPPTPGQLDTIREALDNGRSVEELIDSGVPPQHIMAELEQRRLEARAQRLADEVDAMDQNRLPLPNLAEELFVNENIDAIATLRAQGRTDDEIAEEFFDAFAAQFDGNPPPFLQGQFMDQLLEAFGDDFNDAWIEAFQPRFFNMVQTSTGSVANSVGDHIVRRESGRTFISIYNNGQRVDIPVGPLIGRGAFNAVYAHPTNPRYVIRVNFNAISRELDEIGRAGMKEAFTVGGELVRGPRRRMSLTSDCYDDFDRFAADLNDWYALTGTNAFQRDELLDIFARRNSVEYIELARGQMAGSFSEWLNADLSLGQAIEIYRNLKRLNDRGLVLLDSHGGNLHFERVPGTANEWRMHIIDSGSIVRVRGDSAAERATRARELQTMVTAPQGPLADQLYAATNHGQRFAYERMLGEEMRDEVYEALDDATRAALGSPENLAFVPQLARFRNVRDLLQMTDAERASVFPAGTFELE